MISSTANLNKHRVYECTCGGHPCRPLRATDTDHPDEPFPKPCDHCLGDLRDRPFQIVDRMVHLRDLGIVP